MPDFRDVVFTDVEGDELRVGKDYSDPPGIVASVNLDRPASGRAVYLTHRAAKELYRRLGEMLGEDTKPDGDETTWRDY